MFLWKARPRERPSQVVKHGRTLHELFVIRQAYPLTIMTIDRDTPPDSPYLS